MVHSNNGRCQKIIRVLEVRSAYRSFGASCMTRSLGNVVFTHENEPANAPLTSGSFLKAGKVVRDYFLSPFLMQIPL